MEIDITLPQQAYAVFESLNYTTWNALGEFIDNSIQSYLNNKEILKRLDKKIKLKIDIELYGDNLIIRDNASGIDKESLKRGLKPATKPSISSGLSEFGMGLKTASFWLSRRWKLITKHYNSDKEYTVEFDNVKIYTEGVEKIIATQRELKTQEHYTEIILNELNDIDSSNEIEVNNLIKHISSMYRVYLRNNDVEISFNGNNLQHAFPKVLCAKKVYPDKKDVEWKKDIDFTLSSGKRVYGIAILRYTGNPMEGGFVYIRRNRVIQGIDQGVKIKSILGDFNSKRSQRIYAELNFEGFNVTHTKDKIFLGRESFEFEDKLKKSLDGGELRLLYQAERISYTSGKTNDKKCPTSSKDTAKSPNCIKPKKKTIFEINIPEFQEDEPEISGNILKYSELMKISYGDLYVIENILRILIKKVGEDEGVDFTDETEYEEKDKEKVRRINNKINYIKNKEKIEKLIPIRGDHYTFYIDFRSIIDIIELNYNLFKGYFPLEKITIGTLEKVYRCRNNIAHNSFLDKRNRDYVSSYLIELSRQLSSRLDMSVN